MPVPNVCQLRHDRWAGVSDRGGSTDQPSLADFDHALLRLDAREYTMLTIARPGEAHLAIGGGAGQYVVYATFDNREFWNLQRDEPASGVCMLIVGGQEGDFPATQIVGLEQARSAGRVFLEEGQLDETHTWKRQ